MMTSQSLSKSLILPAILIITLFTVSSCGKRDMDSKQVATELNEPKADATKERDEKFMVQAAEINFQQIMLAKLLQQRSVDEEIKSLAKMLEDFHRSANVELRSIAMQKAIAVPTAASNKVMEDYNQLNMKSAKELDDAYFSMVIQNHESAINRFENYTNGPCDEVVKAWAMGLLPDMRMHLQKAKDLQQGVSSPVSML
jgi:putative membrane protein